MEPASSRTGFPLPQFTADAVLDAGAPRVRERLIDSQPAFQVRVKVGHGNVAAALVNDLLEDLVRRRRGPARCGQVVRQRPHANAAESHVGAVVVTLQRQRAVVEKAALLRSVRNHWRHRLGVIHDQNAVQPDLHVLAAHGGVNLEPLAVGHKLLIHVPQSVERPCLFPLPVTTIASGRVVDLDFEALVGEIALLIRRMEVDSRVARRARQHFHFKLEVAEVSAVHRTCIEQVRPWPFGHELPLFHFPAVLVFARPPSFQAMPVEELYPAIFRGGKPQCRDCSDKHAARNFRSCHRIEYNVAHALATL